MFVQRYVTMNYSYYFKIFYVYWVLYGDTYNALCLYIFYGFFIRNILYPSEIVRFQACRKSFSFSPAWKATLTGLTNRTVCKTCLGIFQLATRLCIGQGWELFLLDLSERNMLFVVLQLCDKERKTRWTFWKEHSKAWIKQGKKSEEETTKQSRSKKVQKLEIQYLELRQNIRVFSTFKSKFTNKAKPSRDGTVIQCWTGKNMVWSCDQ